MTVRNVFQSQSNYCKATDSRWNVLRKCQFIQMRIAVIFCLVYLLKIITLGTRILRGVLFTMSGSVLPGRTTGMFRVCELTAFLVSCLFRSKLHVWIEIRSEFRYRYTTFKHETSLKHNYLRSLWNPSRCSSKRHLYTFI